MLNEISIFVSIYEYFIHKSENSHYCKKYGIFIQRLKIVTEEAPSLKRHSPEDVLKSLRVFRAKDAIKAGVSQPTLSRLTAKGRIVRLDHGIYHHIETEVDQSNIDFIIACHRLGEDSVIGGLSALFHYVLIPQVPQQLWILIPHENRGKFPNYRIIHTKNDLTVGIEDHLDYRIVTIERAIVEAFRYASKMGYQTALTAARTALAEEKTTEEKIHKTAKDLGLWKVMVTNWEAMTTK